MTASLRKLSTITDWQTVGKLNVEPTFFDFVEEELLPAINFDVGEFWAGFENIIDDLTPVNRGLLHVRDELQRQIDDWHRGRQGRGWDGEEYTSFLREIGYLQDDGLRRRLAERG